MLIKITRALGVWFTVSFSLIAASFFIVKIFFLQNTLAYSFMALAAPVILVILILLVVIWLFFNYKLSLIPFTAIILGKNSFNETLALNIPAPKIKHDFSVLTYNVGTFHLDRFKQGGGLTKPVYFDTTVTYLQNLWLNTINTDIICFQEFYTNDYYKSENIISKLVNKGYHYYYTNPIKQPYSFGIFGVITFSKFPIIRADSINYAENVSLNRGIVTDIVKGTDTIRVLNFHLHSMSIRFKKNPTPKVLIQETSETVNKLKRGFELRGSQIDAILTIANRSPYPVILCGDFNDVPYSYVYQKTKQIYKNAFENAGTGFGYTYNRFPWLLRIDNQFCSKSLDVVYCKTLKNKYSDHFPVEAGYIFKR